MSQWSHENPERMAEIAALRERFERKVDRTPGLGPHGDCHEWTGCTNAKGYGRASVGGRLRYTAPIAFFLQHGRWPHPCALHHCDNPPCVRVEHIFEGTHANNAADRDAKGRHRPSGVIGERHGSAKLTEADVVAIRVAYPAASMSKLAACYGVAKSQIHAVVHRKTWRHI